MLRSVGLLVAAFFVGVSFLIGAHFIGILQVGSCWSGQALVPCSGPFGFRKEVGFAAALNWSIGLTLLFPIFIYCAAETYNHARHAISELAARHMIVNEHWAPVPEADITLIFYRQRFWWVLLAAVVLVLGGVFLGDDFLDVVLAAYQDPARIETIRLSNPVLEVDWSIAYPACDFIDAAICSLGPLEQAANIYFAGAAYIYLTWIGAALALSFVVAVLAFATCFVSAEFRGRKMVLVPDLASRDSRRGFEVFEGFFTHAIAGVFMLFAMGYLVTLQNIYLRTEFGNIMLLIFPFVQPGVGVSLDGMVSGVLAAITGQLGVVNPNVVAVTVIGLLTLFSMLLSVAFALRFTARRGMNALGKALDSRQDEFILNVDAYLRGKGITRVEASEALRAFVFWPVRWLKVNRLFIWLAAATVALVVVTLGAYIIAAGLGAVLSSTFSRIGRFLSGDED